MGEPRRADADQVADALGALGVVVYGFHVENGALPLDFVGPGLAELLGREVPDDLTAAAGLWAGSIHHDDRAREAAFMARLARGEASEELYRVVLGDGRVRWVWDRGQPVRGPEGTVTVVAMVGEAPAAMLREVRSLGRPGMSDDSLSATAWTAERVDGRLVEVRIGMDWEETTGQPREPGRCLEALGRVVHPDDRDMYRERMRVILAGRPFEGVFRVIDHSGGVRWLSERATPHVRSGRQVIEGILLDVTGQHPLFDDLKSLDARLRWLLRNVDAHVYTLVADPDGGNPHAEFLGPRLDVVYGESPSPDIDVDALWEASVHPDDRRALDARLEQLARGEAASVVYRLRGVDGQERWIRDSARPRRDPDGRLRIDGIATQVEADTVDAAEARRAARVLAELHDTVFEYELTANGWTARYTSDGISRLLGGRAPDGRNVRDVVLERVHPDDVQTYLQLHDDLSAGRTAQAEFRLIGLDDRIRRTAVRAHPLRATNGPLRAVGVASLVDESPADDAHRTTLTVRQLEVLALLAEGGTTETIAKRLFISPATVRNHVTAILAELGAHSRLEAVAEARRRLLI